MKTDLYSALSGAQSAWRQLEVISNNLANVGTTGFREERVSFEKTANLARVATIRPNTEDGALIVDGDPAHVAIRGDAFFVLEDGTYTRDGGFRIDGTGQLVTGDGTAVSGDGGSLKIEPGETVSIAADGTVTGSKSGALGRFQLVQLAGATPLGGNRWSGTPSAADPGVTVVQGALEGSNADPMRGMVELMEAARFFESQQKAMQTADEMRQRLNRIGGA